MTTVNSTSTAGALARPAQNVGSIIPDPKATLTENYDTFIALLTAQLRNQDPLQPQDGSEFTNQLVQFSQVEQQIESNDKLDALIASINSGQNVQALGYIGKTVEVQTNGLPLQESAARFAVTLARPAINAEARILDSTGKVVQTLPVETRAGTHRLEWNGLDSQDRQLRDGLYRVDVRAIDQEGKTIPTTTQVAGRVTGVDNTGASAQLLVGTLPVELGDVISIREPTPSR